MKHLNQLSRQLPRTADSLLVTQQKVAIFAALAAGLNTLGQALGTWQGLRDDD